jgi:hypothetical protein
VVVWVVVDHKDVGYDAEVVVVVVAVERKEEACLYSRECHDQQMKHYGV